MKTITINLYEFAELSDKAKDKARAWYREGALDYDWWECTYADAKTIGLEITSFDLDHNRHCKGKFILAATEVADKIIAEHGDSCETHKDATAFLHERDAIVDGAERNEHGEFVNEYELDDKLDTCESEFLRTILEDYSIILQHEYEYLLSNESVDETIIANCYTFTEDGERMD